MATKTEQAGFAKIYAEAAAAGYAAAIRSTPTPMVVSEHVSPIDDKSPVKQSWFVSEGVCGFAWIKVYPGTSSFARWLVKEGKARKAYQGGIQIWVSEFGQSMERKEAYARAFASVLTAAGFKAYADSRMD